MVEGGEVWKMELEKVDYVCVMSYDNLKLNSKFCIFSIKRINMFARTCMINLPWYQVITSINTQYQYYCVCTHLGS